MVMPIATAKAIAEAAKYMLPLIAGIEATALGAEYAGEEYMGRAFGEDWYEKGMAYAQKHPLRSGDPAREVVNALTKLHGMTSMGHNPGNPGPAGPKKKRKANRYAILLKQEMKKSRLTGKTAAGRKKKFAAAAKKASALYRKEKKNGSKKTK